MRIIDKTNNVELDKLYNMKWPVQHDRIIKSGLQFIQRHNDHEYRYGNSMVEHWIYKRRIKRLNNILVRYYEIAVS